MVVVIGGAACSSGTDGATDISQPRPGLTYPPSGETTHGTQECALVDAADISRILDVGPVEAHPGMDEPGVATACSWTSPAGVVADVVSYESAGDLVANMKGIPGAEGLAGPGDAAVFVPVPAMLAVQVGDKGVTISLGAAVTARLLPPGQTDLGVIDRETLRRLLVPLGEAVSKKLGER